MLIILLMVALTIVLSFAMAPKSALLKEWKAREQGLLRLHEAEPVSFMVAFSAS